MMIIMNRRSLIRKSVIIIKLLRGDWREHVGWTRKVGVKWWHRVTIKSRRGLIKRRSGKSGRWKLMEVRRGKGEIGVRVEHGVRRWVLGKW
jgi:hypothetical protein